MAEQDTSNPDAPSPGDIEAETIRIIRDLALELRPHARRAIVVRADSNLDRDLGFDSLGRAELLLRLDRAFKVHLPEQLIGSGETPQDFLDAVMKAGPGAAPVIVGPADEPAVLGTVEAPASARTLIEALAAHASKHPDRPHIYLLRGEANEELITYGALDLAARKVAMALLEHGLQPGDRAAIMLPTEPAFFHAFFGILMAGGVPVPVYPPFRRSQVEDHLRRQAGILRDAGARFLITDEEIRNVGTLLYGLTDSLKHLETVERLITGRAIAGPVQVTDETIALIQYTSGSTGDPKGVVLTHANLLSNIRAMGEAMDAGSADVFVSWLPLYHDMGLIGAWLGSLYFAAPVVIMPPLSFLADPGRWLRVMHRHRATLSAAPNFAFELCLKSVRDRDIEDIDLSSMRMLVNGAEPINPGTLTRFIERFEPYGFAPEALAPVYGLAECSVGLAFPPRGRRPIVDRVQRDRLTRHGEAVPARPDDAGALAFVACGHALPRHQIRIIDDTGREATDRREGRLQFKGPSATQGYFRNAERTAQLYDGEWLESDDLAYTVDGDIFITGRIKDIIIKAGRNIYPHELEEAVGAIEGIRKGCVAVFGAKGQHETERLIVLAETRKTDAAERERLRREIIETSQALLETPPDDVVLAGPRAVPKTSSGKIRRSAARDLYEAGAIGETAKALWWQLARLSIAGSWRLAGRGLRVAASYLYAAYWWLVLGLVAAVLWPAVIMLPRRAMRHRAIAAVARTFFRITGTKFTVNTEVPLPAANAMFAVNHASYLDGAVVTASIPGDIAFVAKQELEGNPVAGPFLKRIGTLFVRRMEHEAGVEDTETVLKAAEAGTRIVSFPEGTLTRMPGLLGFRMGSFAVAAKAGVPVIPVTIRGTRSILRGGQWFPRRGRIDVHIGHPVVADGADFAAAVRLRDAVRKQILRRCGEPDLAHERYMG